jgi:serine/threonine-protein kinase
VETSGTNAAATVRCARCGKTWPSNVSTCPEDGADLRPTEPHDLHGLSTFRLANNRRRDEPPAIRGEDDSGTDTNAVDADTALHVREVSVPATPISSTAVGTSSTDVGSAEITAADATALESSPPPTAEPASNPDPTTSTKLDPGFVHLVPGTLVDEYEIEKLLGSGGMGAVYGAHHEKLRRRAAVKVIAPALSKDRDAVERFAQEALALARLSHPNIVSVLSVGTLPGDGRSYYVMEWLDGLSLQTRLERERIALGEALDLVDQIARGLEAAHGAGIVHRDLKPDNVWLQRLAGEERPVVKILDMGLAKLAHHRRTEHTATNVMFGTPQFMSPEQARSSRDVGPQTDVYALGCVVFELLCGRLPFMHDNLAELTVAHQTEVPPRPRELNPAIDEQVDELVCAMLAKEPSERPSLAVVRSTIAGVRKRLETQRAQTPAGSSATITAPKRVATAPATTAPRSRRWMVAVGGTALALCSFWVASAMMRRQGVEDNAEHAVTTLNDASPTSASPQVPARTPAVRVEPLLDASGTEEKRPATPEAPRTTAPRAQAPHGATVDAAGPATIEVDAGTIDAEPVVDAPDRQEPGNQSTGRDPPRDQRLDEKKKPDRPRTPHPPPPIDQGKKTKVDKNQTFNPFTGQPVSP